MVPATISTAISRIQRMVVIFDKLKYLCLFDGLEVYRFKVEDQAIRTLRAKRMPRKNRTAAKIMVA